MPNGPGRLGSAVENDDNRTIPDNGDRSDDKKFNETLIRMLKTPPKPHDGKSDSSKDKKDSQDS